MAEEARALAARELPHASLHSVLAEFAKGAWVPRPRQLRFGFQELRRGFILGTRLKACWVELHVEPRSLRIVSAGTYGRRQFKELASIPGTQFPPPTLDLSRLRLEMGEVLGMLQRTSPLGVAMGELTLSICVHDGRLAWRAQQEVTAVGLRTLLVDAGEGHVLYEKVDWWRA